MELSPLYSPMAGLPVHIPGKGGGCRCHVPEPLASLSGSHSSHLSRAAVGQLTLSAGPALTCWVPHLHLLLPALPLIYNVPHLPWRVPEQGGEEARGGVGTQGAFGPQWSQCWSWCVLASRLRPHPHCPRPCVASKGGFPSWPAGSGLHLSPPRSPTHLLCFSSRCLCCWGAHSP